MSRLICPAQGFWRVTCPARIGTFSKARGGRNGARQPPRRPGGVTGIHRQHGTGDVPAAFAEKIFHHGSDALGLRQAAQRAKAGDAPAAVVSKDEEVAL